MILFDHGYLDPFVFKTTDPFYWEFNIPQGGNVVLIHNESYTLRFNEMQNYNGDVNQHPILGIFAEKYYRVMR